MIENPEIDNPLTLSEFFPEGAINSHPRFGTLARNIRQRRGKKVNPGLSRIFAHF